MTIETEDRRKAGLRRIREAVGPRGWTDDADEIAPHLVEDRGLFRGRTPLLVRPLDTAQVAAVVGICAGHGIPIVPQGGNTGLVGGGVPFESGDEVVLSLSRMNRIRAVDPLNYTLTAEAGCILANVQAAAEEADRLFPLSLAAEGSCQIGGNLSTNAGGIQVLRYGNARDLVLGLEVVLPSGEVLEGLRSLRKDNTGYDLKNLFIGAEGTLGIITAAVLKLFPRPRDVQTAMVAVTGVGAAIELLARARGASGDSVTAFELMPRIGVEFVLRHMPGTQDPLADIHPWYVLMDLASGATGGAMRETMEEVLAAALEDGLVTDAVLASSEAQAGQLWKLRESMSEVQKQEGGSIKHDVAVPVSRVADLIDEGTQAVEAALPGIRVVAFGHVGDGNVHFNLSQPPGMDKAAYLGRWREFNDIIHGIVARMGGSISAEHGIGRLKRDELTRYKSPVELATMQAIKRALDPSGIMNPGKVLAMPGSPPVGV